MTFEQAKGHAVRLWELTGNHHFVFTNNVEFWVTSEKLGKEMYPDLTPIFKTSKMDNNLFNRRKKMTFDSIWDSCFDTKVWDVDNEWKPIFEIGFNGLLKKTKDGPKFKKSQVSWTGFVRNDGSIDEAKRIQATQAVFSKLFHYHTGRTSAYLGTILNALMEGEIVCQGWGFSQNLRYSDCKTPEDKASFDENKKIEKKFANAIDTFIQVLVTLGNGGKGSVAGRRWQKAIYG